MKKLIIVFFSFGILYISNNTISAQGILDKIKIKTRQRADSKVDNAIDKALDKTEDVAKNGSSEAEDKSNNNNPGTSGTTTSTGIKAYQNYDFVPGDKVLFEDNFIGDQDGEFPSHWELISGQAVLNKIKTVPALYFTEGNYARVKPRMKTANYLTDPFTIEYDMYHIPGAYGVMTMFKFMDKDGGFETEASVGVNATEVSYSGPYSIGFTKSLPATESGEEVFGNKWHHVAISFKNNQVKVYVDQYRVLVVPDTKQAFNRVEFAGIGDESKALIITNVRVASGGNMNMIGKKFTESKIVTHGINFDIDKATIKPESMGTLNMVVQVLKDNPEVKFEIGGHTDNTGTAAHNLALSQQRADAVKDQLIKMGVDASRLSSKGFGNTKPIGDNTSPEGKANNRRVEFVKM